MKRVLILGITGQDGSFLAELLLEKGYQVHGLVRRSSVDNLLRIRHILDQMTLHKGDLADPGSIYEAIIESGAEEIYNEADQDHVRWSHHAPAYSLDITAGAVGRTLEAVKNIQERTGQRIKFFQPVSSTMFDDSNPPQDENTPLNPQSPYACAKVCAYLLGRFYRQKYKMFVSTAIMFNHDSERRGEDYLLQRIARGIKIDGDLGQRVDIGYAPEFMEGAWKIMQLEKPDDFVLATGESYAIKELVGGQLFKTKFSDLEKPALIGNCNKAKAAFGWNPKHDAMSVLGLIKEKLCVSERA